MYTRNPFVPLTLAWALLACSSETSSEPTASSTTAATGGHGIGGASGAGGGAAVGGSGGRTGGVVIDEGADEGLSCFVVTTDQGVFYFDKAGAGLTSMIDLDGVDWIDFRPEGTPGVPDGQSGWYRGIPNMALDQFGHPGYLGATSTTPDPLGVPLSDVTIHARKGPWSVSWEFHPRFAKMTVHAIGESYWLLYEGTPGGTFSVDDSALRSNGTSFELGDSWSEDVASGAGADSMAEWVGFASADGDRTLVMLHADDDITDSYRPMAPMTVFGFGRQGGDLARLLSATQEVLVVGFAEGGSFSDVSAAVERWIQADALQPSPLP